MARPIDELIIQIKADTRDLQKKLDQIEGKIKTTGAVGGATFGGMAVALRGMIGPALAVAGGIAAIVVPTQKIAEIGSAFEDLKDSLNTVFGSIEAGDQAMNRVLQFAQKTPFQIETATKAFIALQSAGVEPNSRMLQVFADTASTSVDQLGVFEALVRTVQRSASGGLGLEELNMIMDRGIDVLGILNDQLGLTKDEIAKFGATAEGAKLITDALINGLETKFGNAMESKMDNLSTKASNMQISFKQLADAIFQSGLGDQLKDMADFLTVMANSSTRFVQSFTGAGLGISLTGDTATDLQLVTDELQKQQTILGGIGKTRKGVFPSLLSMNQKMNDSDEKLFNKTSTRIENLKRKQKELQKPKVELEKIDKKTIMRQGELARSFTFLSNEIDKLNGDTDELAFASENLGDVFKANEVQFAKMGIFTLAQLEEKLKAIKGATGDLEETFSEILAPAIQSLSLSFTNEFVNALLEGENALDSFHNFSKNIVSQIVSTFLQLTVVNKILNTIFPQLKLPTMNIGDIGKKAGGGKIQRGVPTLVGERGAEIFVPDSGGTIMNNMNSKNAMGGTPIIVNQSVNFATGVVPTVRAEITKMMPQIAQVTKGAVAEASVRGGTYRRLLQGG